MLLVIRSLPDYRLPLTTDAAKVWWKANANCTDIHRFDVAFVQDCRSMTNPDDTYVMHWFTMLLACEIRERSLLWSDHDLVRNRKVATDYVSRIQGVSAEVLERSACGISDYFLEIITWVATRIKVSQSQRYLAGMHIPGMYNPVFFGEPTESDNLHQLWNEQEFDVQQWIVM
jgi:hypothetical protein